MDEDVRQLVQRLHDCPTRLVLVTAGAGTQALSDLLGVAGATRTLLEALVPYSVTAFDEFLGQKPKQYVADETGRLMAGRAFTRARFLEVEQRPALGVACTATIVTDRPKRGAHRAHIATWNDRRLVSYGLYLHKGARDRAGEEDVVSRVMLNAIARACGIEEQIEVPLVEGDRLAVDVYDFAQTVSALQNGEINYFGVHDNGRIRLTNARPQVVLSGAFNPLHDGHIGLANAAQQVVGKPVAFELSAVNADKPPLAPAEVLDRVAQFAGRYPVYVSNAPTFLEKARIYPGATFVVGYDTAARVLQPRYYGSSQRSVYAALEEIAARGCRFLVAGRIDGDGVFRAATDLAVPAQYAGIFNSISAEIFREDVSSTELRLTGRKGSR